MGGMCASRCSRSFKCVRYLLPPFPLLSSFFYSRHVRPELFILYFLFILDLAFVIDYSPYAFLMSKGTHEVTKEEYTQHIIVINMELTAIMNLVLFVKRDRRHCTDVSPSKT